MGTRGILGYIIRGRYRGTYVHSDSYPEGLGADIAEFLSMLTEEDRVRLIERLNEIKWVSLKDPIPPETMEEYKAAGYNLSGSMSDGKGDWDTLLAKVRETKMLRPILEGKLRHMVDSTNFATDWIFCEWAYWVDFESKSMEVVKFGRRWGEWTFAEMKVPQSYWATMVEEAQEERKTMEERKKAMEGKKRLV